MKKRLLAVSLAVMMLINLFPLPVLALEAQRPEWAVTAFDPLDGGTALQTVPQGGGEPVLPDTLTAWAYQVEDDTEVTVLPEQTPPEGEQPPADEQGPDIQQITIPKVTWTAEPEYDHNTPGAYIYTPVLPAAYAVDEGVELPTITVTVEAAQEPEQTPVERVQALIDALPDPEGITLDNAEDTAAQIGDIDVASETLTGEERAALDFTRYEAVMLTLAALMDDTPTFLATESGIKYLDWDDSQKKLVEKTYTGNATVVESSSTTWGTAGQTTWYVVNSTLEIVDRKITVNGDVHLILKDACKLTAKSSNPENGGKPGGINVAGGNSLTIYAQSTGTSVGQLSAIGGNYQAGIGGGKNQSGGTITINGGVVTATGGGWAAGIGGGYSDSGNTWGTITINGGSVTATGAYDAAGIGGAYNGKGGTITINGGSVTATNGHDGTGIGSGYLYTSNKGGTITITGGNVTAIGNTDETGNGIGGSEDTVTIIGGSVTAMGQWDGIRGQFSTNENGAAFIVASSIYDQTGKGTWSGVIFEGVNGQVYGSPTLTTDAEIPSDKTLTVPSGKTLIIPSGVTLTNNGTIINNGLIINKGNITGTGTINGNEPNKIRVTFNANGGSVSPESTQVTYNSTYGELPTPTRDRYTFVGWYTAADGGTKVESTTQVTITAAQTLYAHWLINTPYIDENGSAYDAGAASITDQTTWTTGWYVVDSNTTISSRITVSGNVKLILADGCALTVIGGINVSSGNSLTIYAQSTGDNMGRLTAQGGTAEAGIGGGSSFDCSCGEITINGGIVTATGDASGAGIGGGNGGSGGTITINGGIVNASGFNGGAGIGDGGNRYYDSDSVTVTINGGIVTATGGSDAAGIGGGSYGYASGRVTITGGIVTATGDGGAAGIGIGKEGTGGSFSTGANGKAFIVASSISDQSAKSSWSGVIFEGNNGQVYGNPTLAANAEIPSGKTLTIPTGKALTVPTGVTLTNSGILKIDGTLTVNGTFTNSSTTQVKVALNANGGSVSPSSGYVSFASGGVSGLPTPTRSGYTFAGWYTAASGGTAIANMTPLSLSPGQTLYAHWTENKSQVTVTFSKNNPAYGDTITITATIAAANTNGLRAAAQDTVTFSLGGTTIGTANVSGNTATLTNVTLTGENWKPGSKTVTAEFGGSTAMTGSTGTGTLTVKKATPTVTPPTAKSLTYTGAAQELISAGGTTSGCTMQYSTDNSTWGTSVPTGTDAKTYTVYYKVAGNDYYNDAAAQSVTVTIGRKTITGTISITGTPTMGETLTARNSASGETVSYQWYRGDNSISGATGSTYTLVAADVGQTIKVTATGTGNYTGTATSSQTAAVGKATPTVSQWPTASAITYGQSLGDSTLTGGTASVAGTFSWTNTSTKPAVADSGTTQYDVTFTPSGAGYNPVTGGKATLTVNKATLTPSATATGKTYDGTTSTTGTISLTGAVNSENPTANGTFAFENADVGTGRTVNVTNITLTGDWGANYRLSSDSTTTTATIDPKSISGATVELGDSLTYTGQQQEQVVQSVTIGNLTATYTVSDNQQTNAGTYTLTVTGNGNFTGTLTKDFTIAKATTNSITGLTCDNIVFGGTPSPTATATFGTPTYSYSNQQSGTYGVWNTSNAKGTWYVKATVAGTDNYNGAEQIISFQVTAQQEATPTASIDYGAETLTGLTADAKYSITPADGTAVTVTASENGTINIQPGWFGKTLSIVKIARDSDYSDSAAQSLPIPARPNRPTVQGVNETFSGENDGQITSTSTAMEYGTNGSSWTDCTGTSITGLTPGTYYVRTKAVTGPSPASFASDYATVTIQAGPQRTYTLEVAAPTFTTATYGYTRPAAQAITITSKGNSAATISSVAVSSSDFTIGGSGSSVAVGSSITTWTIQPNAGLAVGTHTGTITVTYNNNATATATVSFTVSKAALTPTASANGKTYDGTTTASGTINLSGAVSGENPAASGTFAFENANAGTGKTVNVTGITLTGDWSANYQLSTTSITTTANITPKPITGATVTLGDSLTYTGQQQTQTVTSVTINNLTATYTVSGNQQTDAGTYTLTVTGTGNFTGSTTKEFTIAKASNSISNFTCADIVHGTSPSPTATASFGTPAFTYSSTEGGSYGAWDNCNAKGTWYVKASVEGTDNYEGAEAITSFSVTAEQEAIPNAGINYTDETLTGLESGASYSITPAGGAAVAVTASSSGTINIQEDWFGKTLSIVKTARDENYSDSEAQSLTIPQRPAAPSTPLKLTKTANGITVTNTYSGCEFSVDGTNWQDSSAFNSLTAGTAYTVQVRVKATASSFKSASMTQAVTTVNENGTTTVKPGESVTTGGATITNDGDKTTITGGSTTTTVTPGNNVTVNGDGTVTVPGGSTVKTGENGPEITVGDKGGTVGNDGGVTVPSGGSVQVGDTTITSPSGGKVTPNGDGGVTVPSGSTVKTGENGPEISVGGQGGTVGNDGGVTVPSGGSVQVGDTTITSPGGGKVTPNGDGGVTVPGGSTVKTGENGPEITVGGQGGTVGNDGGVTVPDGGSIQVGDTTITSPGGGKVTPNEDGTVNVPGGSTVKTGENGPEITVGGQGGTVGNDGGVTVPDGGSIQVGDTTITSPGGGKVTPNEDGTVTVPGGSTVQTGDGPEITVGPGTSGTVGGNGSLTIPQGGTIHIGGGTKITLPNGGEIKPKNDGTVNVPGGSTVKTGENGPEITVGGQGGTVGNDGGVTVPDGGSIQVGDTTITSPSGGKVTPNEDGTVTVPGGSTVQTGDGTEITVGGQGGTITGGGELRIQVTFDADGGSVTPETKQVTCNKPYGELPTPSRSGYTFDGWYTEASGGSEITGATTVAQANNHTLYAHWRQNSTVTVTFSNNPTYGGRLTITATIGTPPANNGLRAATDTVTFFMGGETLGTATVSNNTATLEVTLTGEKWKPGEKTITAEFGGSATYTGSTGTGTVTVVKATPTVAVTAASSLTYTGAAQTLISAGSATGGELQYSLSQDSGYSTAVPTGTEAKTYTVYYKVVGNDCYNDVAVQSVNVPIAKASLTITAKDQTITYGQSITTGVNQVDAAGLVNGETLTGITLTPSTADATTNGTITPGAAVISGGGADNYNVKYNDGALTIKPKLLTVTGATATSRAYDGTKNVTITAVTLDGVVSGDHVSVDTSKATGTISGADASSYGKITLRGLTLTGTKASCYSLNEQTKTVDSTVEIRKATVPTPPTGCSFNISNYLAKEYNYLLSLVCPQLNPDQVTENRKDWGERAYTIESVVFTQAGYYTEGTARIGKAEEGGQYANRLYLPVLFNSVETTGTVGTVTVKVSSKNYADFTNTISIVATNKEAVSFEGFTTPDKTYDGTPYAYEGTITAKDAGGNTVAPTLEITYAGRGETGYSERSTPPTNAGEFSMIVRVADTDGAYIGRKSYNFTIRKASGTASVTMADFTEGQEPSVPVPVSITNGVDHVEYSYKVKGADDSTYMTQKPSTVGEYTVRAYFPAVLNYEAVTATADFSILPQEFTVTFDADGGTVDPPSMTTIGGKLPGLPTATKSGYCFDGWYTAKDGGEQVTVNMAFSQNTTVYAHWTDTTPREYTITFDANGGTVSPSSAATSGGKLSDLPAATRSGYRFDGWYTAQVNGEKITTNTLFSENTTIYAHWTYISSGSSGDGGGSYTPPTYPPTVEKPSEGGTVTVSPSRPITGDKVTITPKPDTGYEVDQITVTDKNGKPVDVTKNPDGRWSFIQPNGKVTIQVTYKAVEMPWHNPFTDVSENDWYYEAVRFVQERGLMNGYSDGRFGPNDNLSRAQLAQILFNKEGKPVVNYLMDFSDVAGEAWYTEAIRWAAAMGIVGGYGNGQFGPNDNITREQLAVMLWRYSKSPAATNKELHFNDTDEISGYALEAMRWAVENGIINGYGDGRLNPGGLATRAQVAQMLMNFLKNG